MTEPLAKLFHRTAAIVAGLVALLAISNFLYNVSEGEPIFPVAALGFAAIIWLAGRCCLLGAPGTDPHPAPH